jgi:hypothetical protein
MAITRLSVDGYGARRAGSFAGRAEVISVVEVEQDDGKGSGASRKKYRDSLYPDTDLVRFSEQPKEVTDADKSVLSDKQTDSQDKSKESGIIDKKLATSMADAFDRAGIKTPDQFIREQEEITAQKKIKMAAIMLLLLD